MAVFQWEMESYICLQVSYLLVHMDAWIAIVSQYAPLILSILRLLLLWCCNRDIMRCILVIALSVVILSCLVYWQLTDIANIAEYSMKGV